MDEGGYLVADELVQGTKVVVCYSSEYLGICWFLRTEEGFLKLDPEKELFDFGD